MKEQEKTILTALSFVVDGKGDLTKKFFDPTKIGSLASARLQLMPALKSAIELDCSTQILSLHSSQYKDFSIINRSNICLIGKMSANTEDLLLNMTVANLAAITRLKNNGATVVLQHSDNTFHGNTTLKNFYKDIMHLSDYVVYPSKSLYKITQPYIRTKIKQAVIPDPWQLLESHKPRKLKDDEKVRIIWFGSNKNITYLINSFSDILKKTSNKRHYELTILCNDWALQEFKKGIACITQSHENWTIRAVLWKIDSQPQQLEAEISRAHIALIPSNPSDPLKAGVSHNRIVDAIRGGCITVASPMESYKELSQLAILGENIGETLNHALKNYDQYCKKIIEDRKKLLEQFDPINNHSNWLHFWKRVMHKSSSQR